MTLTEFLLARIAEDAEEPLRVLAGARRNGKTHAHRALVECEAKRRIVAAHPKTAVVYRCDTCAEAPVFPCPTLRILGVIYAGHPDYREEWRPV